MRSILILLTGFVVLSQGVWADSTDVKSAVHSAQEIPADIQNYLNPNSGCSTGQQPNCVDLYENFCKELYKPGNEGNLTLKAGSRSWDIQLGNSPKTNLKETLVAFAKAKISARDSFPPDLKKYLDKEDYFGKLQKYLNMKDLLSQSIEEQNQTASLSSQLSSIWNNATASTIKERLEKVHPGYHSTRYLPPVWSYDAAHIGNALTAEIHADIWKNNPKWHEIENAFKLIKDEYVKMLGENTKIPPDVKKDWIDRVNTIRLKLPGSDPLDQSPDADQCASTEVNASYSRTDHSLTVCAGLFNSMDSLFVMSHEIGHSMDPGTTAVLQQTNSDMGKGLKEVQKQLCESKSPACPSSWASLKAQFDQDLASFPKPVVQNEAFLSCLKSQEASHPMDPKTIKDSADRDVISYFSNEATMGAFMDGALPEVEIQDGKKYPNPYYLKPYCDVRNWKTDLTLGTIGTMFSAEFACEDPKMRTDLRMDAAIKTAQKYYGQVAEKVIPLGGKFSVHPEMTSAGFSENVQERFADAIGLRVFARVMKGKGYAGLEQRRDEFLSAGALFCDAPSAETEFPAEAAVQKKYSLEPHSLNSSRRHEFLIRPIREALDCRIDNESQTRDCDQI